MLQINLKIKNYYFDIFSCENYFRIVLIKYVTNKFKNKKLLFWYIFMWKIFWKTTISTLLNATLTISKGERKNWLNRENWKKK